jgi:hypothetical protein
MSPRNMAGGATRLADTTAAQAGHQPNVTQPQRSQTGPGQNSDHDRHRDAQDSALQAGKDAGEAGNTGDAGEAPGLFEKHKWLVPATVVFSIIAAFALMMILNWAAGGGAPFSR